MKNTCKTWNEFFNEHKKDEYCINLHHFLDIEYDQYVCYPPRDKLFAAFRLTPLEEVKVVIIGQDPYHEPNQAMGLSFSVPKGVKVPPSLVNIFKEIKDEYNKPMNFNNGDLTYLATQGVLLLNSILSVREHDPMSHNIIEYDLFIVIQSHSICNDIEDSGVTSLSEALKVNSSLTELDLGLSLSLNMID